MVVLRGLVALFVCSLANAQQPVSVPVSIMVTVPLQVEAGVSFKDAALAFCQRNQLPTNNAEKIEQALVKKWSAMTDESRTKEACHSWQISHSVHPMKDWGTLPTDLRVKWLELECDSKVSPEPPVAVVSLNIQVGQTVLVLRAFEGDTVGGSVRRFCATHGIDYEQNGEALIRALSNALVAKQSESNPAEDTKTLLFALPINVDGKIAKLKVHEGDKVPELVKAFCEAHGVDQLKFGEAIAAKIIDEAQALSQRLQAEMQPRTGNSVLEKKSEPQLLLDIPIDVDGNRVSMKLYDGDIVDERISQFCETHGLVKEQHAPVLLQHITERAQGL